MVACGLSIVAAMRGGGLASLPVAMAALDTRATCLLPPTAGVFWSANQRFWKQMLMVRLLFMASCLCCC